MFDNPSLLLLELEIALFLICAISLYILYNSRKKQIATRLILDDVINSMGYGLVYFDKKGAFKAASKTACEIIPIDQILENGKYLPDFFNYLYDHALESDRSTKKIISRATGEYKLENISFREVIKTEKGHLSLVLARETEFKSTILILINIDQQYKREQKFNLVSEENYQLYHAIETANIGVVISAARKSGNPVIFANSAISEITGLSRAEIIDDYWHNIFDAFEGGVDMQSIEAAFDNGGALETSLTRRVGSRNYWYSLNINPVTDDLGKTEYFIGIFKDTTELKVKEAEFYQAQKLEALGQLSAGVAHDFNNILSIVDGYTILAERRLSEDPLTCADYLKRILVATQRGAALTKRMMAFGSQKVTDNQAYNLNQIIKDQEMLMHAVLDTALVKLTLNYEDQSIYVHCTPDSFSQIIMNLIINARDAIGEQGGEITLSAFIKNYNDVQQDHLLGSLKQNTNYACVCVSDTGSGMNDELISKIFNPFFTTKMDGKGSGLGLSVVYGLVNDIQGAVSVKSELGKGTAITIYMPLAPVPDNLAWVEGASSQLQHDVSGLVAMVVDNEPDILLVTSEMLRSFGMSVLSANSGDEALVMQDDFEGHIDVLVSDILMPEMNGIKLAELFHSLRPETKIVFVSGYASTPDRKALVIPEFASFIAKPAHPETIRGALEGFLLAGKEVQDNVGRIERKYQQHTSDPL